MNSKLSSFYYYLNFYRLDGRNACRKLMVERMKIFHTFAAILSISIVIFQSKSVSSWQIKGSLIFNPLNSLVIY